MNKKELAEKLVAEGKRIVELEFQLEEHNVAKRFLSYAEDFILEAVEILGKQKE